MKKLMTKDSSETFYSEKFEESYHCLGGAVSEARIKFIGPCRIKELAESGSIVLLDFCFGLGYNSAAAIDAALDANPECKIKIIGLENDANILDELQCLNPEFKNYDLIKELNSKKYESEKGNVTIKLIIADAKDAIKKLDEKFDAVLFDPFSPKKCPDLWTEDIFIELKKRMKKGAVLATYSCATHVRQKLRLAGFEVKDGPVFGRKSPATIAIA